LNSPLGVEYDLRNGFFSTFNPYPNLDRDKNTKHYCFREGKNGILMADQL